MIVPVIIAGGKGLRLWPQSREQLPKPFVCIVDQDRTLLQSTFERLKVIENLQAPLVVCNAAHANLVQAQAISAGYDDITQLLEPEGRDTAPAICAAALLVERMYGVDATMLVLPADHFIADEMAFANAVASGAELAALGLLATFAIQSTSPATGYGYLKLGGAIDEAKQQFKLSAFIEKPDQGTAQKFVDRGGYAWNSGMFMFKSATLLESFALWQPEILKSCKSALPNETSSTHVLNQKAFSQAPPISIDYAIMEKATNTATVVADLGWSDVGDWQAVWQAALKDVSGVVTHGNVHAINNKNSILSSDGPLLVGLGLENMMAIGTKDAILIAPLSRAQDVKKVAESLAALGHREATQSTKVFQPWGWHENLHFGPDFLVVEFAINPGAKLPLHGHRFRVEHWVCTKGQGMVTRGAEQIELRVGDHVAIPMESSHSLENTGTEMLHIIETQAGKHTGPEDVEYIAGSA